LLALAMLLALGPRLAAEQLPIRSFTTADGLANDSVNCIVQDRYGFLWFCTQEGLSRFDGYAFATFGRESGLPSLAVLDFLETGDGEYWVATGRGLCRFDAAAARCEAQALGGGDTVRRAQALLKDTHGRLWVGTNEGLFRSEAEPRNGAFRAVGLDPSLDPPTVVALAESGDRSLWVVTGEGVWRILPDGRRVFHEVESGSTNRLCASLHADARGRIWIGHFGLHGGVTVFASLPASALPPGELPTVRAAAAPPDCPEDLAALPPGHACIVTRAPFPRQGGTAFSTSSDGTLWAGTLNAGLLHFEESGVRRHTTEQGLSSTALLSVLEDRSGDVWIGTESRGVMMWTRRGLVSYGEADGISPIRIVSLFTSHSGDVYALNSRSILNRFDGQGFEAVRPNVRGSMTFRFGFGPRLALQGRSGDWWMASDYGLQRFTGIRKLQDLGRARPAAVVSADAPAGSVGPVFEDSRGDVWAGAAGRRLIRWEQDTGALRSYLLSDLPRSSEVTAFAEDRAGTVWVGLGDEGSADRFSGRAAERGGLVRIRGDRPELVVLDQPGEPDIRWLHNDRSGRLWFAAGRGGLGRIDDPTAAWPRAIAYGRAQGLSSEMVLCLAEDRWGRIYVGTDMGVDRLEVATGRIRHLGVADGLVAGDVASATSDDSGRLWFGTPAGLSVLTPEEEPEVTLPAVRIMSLRIGGIARRLPGLGTFALGGLELSAEDAPIEIAFAGVAPAPGWKRQYRFRLEGADKEWSAPTERHEVNYTRLSPGAYRFRVQAWSADSAPSPEPSFVAFRILPPVWRRWWFLGAAGFGAAALAYAGFRYRLRMLLEVERVRTGIATDLHDDIGSSLSQIAILSEVARQREEHAAGAARLASIAQLSRAIVGSMSDIVWAVNPHRDSLHDLTRRMRGFASETFGAMDVLLRFSAPPDEDPMRIPADLRRQVFLIFKEAATNAASHSGCREVTVDLALDGDWLTLTVVDDGRGMEPERDPEGHGLRSMAERARALGGELRVRSEPGRGTTVTLRAPLRQGGWRRKPYAST